MKVSAFGKLGIGLGACALVLGGLAAPAQADPAAGTYATLAGLGSDTTQDVVGGLAAAIGNGILASYDASDASQTVLTRAGGTAIPRANGSGAGRDLLRVAIGQTESATVAVLGQTPSPVVTTSAVAGQIQFARSSSGAGSNAVDGGVLAYIPFAKDAVSFATAPGSVIPATLSKAEVVAIFKGQLTKVVVNGATTTLQGPSYTPVAGDTVTPITTFIPQSGSGTRSYWLGQMGITESDISNNVYPNLKAKDFGDVAVQEHKGAALVSGTPTQNAGAIEPFSIAQWVAQGNAKSTDHRAGALIGAVDGAVATTGSAGSYALNPAYSAYTRAVYNIVPSVLADDPTSQIAKTFVGSSSLVCAQTATITSFGFGLLPAGECGDSSVRAYLASPSTTELTIAVPSAVVGKTVSTDVAITSVGNGGGKVNLYNGVTLLASAKVAAGASTAKLVFSPAVAGSLSVSAVFVPTLAGVAASASAAVPVTVSAAPIAPAVASTTTLASSAKPVVGGSFKVTATVAASKPSTGTVTFFDGSTKVSTVAVSAGKASTSIKAVKTSYQLRAVFSSSSPARVKGSASSVLKVTAAKATSKVVVAKLATVKLGKKASVKVTVSAKGVMASGKVVVKEGKKTLATGKLVKGKVTVKLPKLKAGKHKIVVTYTGSSTVAAAKSATKTLAVKR